MVSRHFEAQFRSTITNAAVARVLQIYRRIVMDTRTFGTGKWGNFGKKTRFSAMRGCISENLDILGSCFLFFRESKELNNLAPGCQGSHSRQWKISATNL